MCTAQVADRRRLRTLFVSAQHNFDGAFRRAKRKYEKGKREDI